MKQANQLALSFASDLGAIRRAQSQISHTTGGDEEMLHVQTTGASLTELYESLRNASQNAEENLQLAHAITRYIERFFVIDNTSRLKHSGEILITELTMAGYLANDSISMTIVDHISDLIRRGCHA